MKILSLLTRKELITIKRLLRTQYDNINNRYEKSDNENTRAACKKIMIETQVTIDKMQRLIEANNA